jgi:hypothetical protein
LWVCSDFLGRLGFFGDFLGRLGFFGDLFDFARGFFRERTLPVDDLTRERERTMGGSFKPLLKLNHFFCAPPKRA